MYVYTYLVARPESRKVEPVVHVLVVEDPFDKGVVRAAQA